MSSSVKSFLSFSYIYLESKSHPSSVLSSVFCFSIWIANLQGAPQWAYLLVFTLCTLLHFQDWTTWLTEQDGSDGVLTLRVAHERCCGFWFCLSASLFLALPGLLTLGVVSTMCEDPQAALWSSRCEEKLRPPDNNQVREPLWKQITQQAWLTPWLQPPHRPCAKSTQLIWYQAPGPSKLWGPWNIHPKEPMHPNVHSSTIYNRQVLEAT